MSSLMLTELNITREADYPVNEFLTPKERQTKIDRTLNIQSEALKRRKYIEDLQQKQRERTAGKPITYTHISI